MIRVHEVPKRDWALYFTGVYMKYEDKIVSVTPTVDGATTVLHVTDKKGFSANLYTREDLSKLEVWWPPAGAYNYRGSAVYVARKASRCMRKSCSPRSHYYVKWGHPTPSTVRYLLNGPNHMSWSSAKDALDSKLATSVAVCRDLIVESTKYGYRIVFRGTRAGEIRDGEFIPENDFSPITKLATHRLVQEGMI